MILGPQKNPLSQKVLSAFPQQMFGLNNRKNNFQLRRSEGLDPDKSHRICIPSWDALLDLIKATFSR